jgi:hypothetical protein
MKRTIWTGVSTAIVGFATVVGAQTSSAPQSTTPATEAQITVTGCLKQGVMTVGSVGTAGVTGTAGTAGTTATATTGDNSEAALLFTLVNATPAQADATSTTDAASTTGTASTTDAATATSASGQTYRLIANPSALSPLVGKKLALTGVLDPQDNAALSTDRSAGSDAHAPVLRVKSGKIVAASCQ